MLMRWRRSRPRRSSFPDDEGVPATECFQCGIESRPRVEPTRGAVLVEPAPSDASGT
jgi:hypothetical protein